MVLLWYNATTYVELHFVRSPAGRPHPQWSLSAQIGPVASSPGPGPLRRRAAGRGRSRRSGVSAPRNRRIATIEYLVARAPGCGESGRRGYSWPLGPERPTEWKDRKASPGKRILRKTTQNSNGNECGVRRSTPGPAELQQAPAVARPRPWRSPGTSFSPSQSADSADSHR
jgi:hypothetical protein